MRAPDGKEFHMSTTGARAAGATAGTRTRDRGRTLAQWFCSIVGPVLILVGVLGFIADANFDHGQGVQGDGFLGFEVNGWHNIVHIASGLFLLAMAKKRKTAKTATIAFGAIYGLVTIIGLIDGNDVLGVIPVNPADNVLHVLLSAGSLVAGFASPADDLDRDRDQVGGGGTPFVAGDETRRGERVRR
jgi:hypothetical protein